MSGSSRRRGEVGLLVALLLLLTPLAGCIVNPVPTPGEKASVDNHADAVVPTGDSGGGLTDAGTADAGSMDAGGTDTDATEDDVIGPPDDVTATDAGLSD